VIEEQEGPPAGVLGQLAALARGLEAAEHALQLLDLPGVQRDQDLGYAGDGGLRFGSRGRARPAGEALEGRERPVEQHRQRRPRLDRRAWIAPAEQAREQRGSGVRGESGRTERACGHGREA
jgi:hypothetical protein